MWSPLVHAHPARSISSPMADDQFHPQYSHQYRPPLNVDLANRPYNEPTVNQSTYNVVTNAGSPQRFNPPHPLARNEDKASNPSYGGYSTPQQPPNTTRQFYSPYTTSHPSSSGLSGDQLQMPKYSPPVEQQQYVSSQGNYMRQYTQPLMTSPQSEYSQHQQLRYQQQPLGQEHKKQYRLSDGGQPDQYQYHQQSGNRPHSGLMSYAAGPTNMDHKHVGHVDNSQPDQYQYQQSGNRPHSGLMSYAPEYGNNYFRPTEQYQPDQQQYQGKTYTGLSTDIPQTMKIYSNTSQSSYLDKLQHYKEQTYSGPSSTIDPSQFSQQQSYQKQQSMPRSETVQVKQYMYQIPTTPEKDGLTLKGGQVAAKEEDALQESKLHLSREVEQRRQQKEMLQNEIEKLKVSTF